MKNPKFSRRVILSPAKDLTQASLITLIKHRDTNFVGEVPHFVRDDLHWARPPLPFTSSR